MAAPTRVVSAKDMPAHKELKLRTDAPGSRGSSAKELKKQLETKEDEGRKEKDKKYVPKHLAEEENPFPDDADDDFKPLEEEDDDDDDDEDDDTEELLRELEKIKKEKEAEKRRIEEEKEKEEARSKKKDILSGNQLLLGDQALKRKWDDDTVFKNQAATAPKQQKRWVNDAVRSDFHRKFLSKYII